MARQREGIDARRLQPDPGEVGVVVAAVPGWKDAGGRRDVPVRARE